jgi:hypothetical protein
VFEKPRTALLLCALSLTAPARAADRFDHRGSVGLLFGAGVDFKDSVPSGHQERDQGVRMNIDAGGTLAIGHDGNEAKVWGRGSFGASTKDWAIGAGYRGYFGAEQFKTFFDLDAVFHLTPFFTVGPRLGIGIQYEIVPVVGIFAATGAQIGGGPGGLRVSFDAMAGLQFRSYLLE